MAIDFYGVRLAGRIRQFTKGSSGGSVAGKVVELWTENQDSELTKDLGALAFVSQIDVNLKMGENASITMVLTPPFEDALKFMQSELIRFGVGRLEVELGYNTGTTTGSGATQQTVLPFSGFLQKPDVSIGSDVTITLHALGVGYQMNVVGGTESQPFKTGMSYADAVRETLEKYVKSDGSSGGLVVTDLYKFVPTEKQNKETGDVFFRPVGPNTVSKGRNGKPDANVINGIIHKGPRNDWWFVKEVVQENGYDLFINGNELYIVKKSFWITSSFGQKGDRKQFLLRGNVDPTRNMFPILSFSSPTDAVWLQPGIGKLIARDVDPSKENPDGLNHTASGENTEIARGKESADPIDIAEESSKWYDEIAVMMHGGDPSDESVRKQIDAHWTDKNMQSGIQGQFATIGIPSLTPGESVQVGGFEPMGKPWGAGGIDPAKAIFNGVYGVIEVGHRVGVGGWDTTFLGIMNYFPKVFVDANRARKAKEAEEEKAAVQIQEQEQSKSKTKSSKAKPSRQTVAKDDKIKTGTGTSKTVQPKVQK
jgi:hypothetical protein